jgi:hypothetical protein
MKKKSFAHGPGLPGGQVEGYVRPDGTIQRYTSELKPEQKKLVDRMLASKELPSLTLIAKAAGLHTDRLKLYYYEHAHELLPRIMQSQGHLMAMTQEQLCSLLESGDLAHLKDVSYVLRNVADSWAKLQGAPKSLHVEQTNVYNIPSNEEVMDLASELEAVDIRTIDDFDNDEG